MSLPSVAVIGGGVIGRTAALELAHAGHAVTLLTAEPPEATTSAKAAALWRPFAAHPAGRVHDWAVRTFARLVPLAGDPSSGVRMVHGRSIGAHPDEDLGWTRAAPDAVIEPNARGGVTVLATLPLIDMSRHLPWLRDAGTAFGVVEIRRRIASVDEAFEYGDRVVLATGLETNALVPGAGLYPIQGQIVRVANPGGVEWRIDERPDGLLYIIPRIDEVVIGGTEVVGADSLEPDPAVEAAILARAADVLPWIAGEPITSRAVGLRPGRAEVRLDRVGDVIHCYGHGGSGVTLAFACAEEIVALARG